MKAEEDELSELPVDIRRGIYLLDILQAALFTFAGAYLVILGLAARTPYLCSSLWWTLSPLLLLVPLGGFGILVALWLARRGKGAGFLPRPLRWLLSLAAVVALVSCVAQGLQFWSRCDGQCQAIYDAYGGAHVTQSRLPLLTEASHEKQNNSRSALANSVLAVFAKRASAGLDAAAHPTVAADPEESLPKKPPSIECDALVPQRIALLLSAQAPAADGHTCEDDVAAACYDRQLSWTACAMVADECAAHPSAVRNDAALIHKACLKEELGQPFELLRTYGELLAANDFLAKLPSAGAKLCGSENGAAAVPGTSTLAAEIAKQIDSYTHLADDCWSLMTKRENELVQNQKASPPKIDDLRALCRSGSNVPPRMAECLAHAASHETSRKYGEVLGDHDFQSCEGP